MVVIVCPRKQTNKTHTLNEKQEKKLLYHIKITFYYEKNKKYEPTSQNGQTHQKNSSAVADELFEGV